MRAAVLTAPGAVSIIEQPAAELVPGGVRVEIEGSGVCASNVPVWQGRSWFDYPRPAGSPGHEAWGRVVESDDAAVAVGQRVAVLADDAFTSCLVVPGDRVVALPSSLDGRPVPAEALGCAVNAARRSGFEPGQRVAVVGIGFLGALLVSLAAQAGAHVIAVARKQSSLELARHYGAAEIVLLDDHQRVIDEVAARTDGAFCARVVEATGAAWPLDVAGELTGVGGRLVIAGYHQDGLRQVNVQLWNWRGLDVVNAHERDPAVAVCGMRDAVAAVAAGQLDPDPLYTHTYPVARLAEAMDATAARPAGFVKALVTW